MAVTTNKNEWVNTFANAIGESNPPAQPNAEGGASGNNDKYAALETTSYKDMLSSKIQANAAKEQAIKYSNNVLGANGVGSQGMAESARAGIMNNYARAINDAQALHGQNLLDIETQRQNDLETKGEEGWQNAMTMLSQATSQEDLDYIKNNFYAGMTDEQKKMFDYYYASYGRDVQNQNVQDDANWAQRVFSTAEIEEKNGISFKDFQKNSELFKRFGDKFDVEGIDDVKNFYMTANNGELVEVTASQGEQSERRFFMFYNGKLFELDNDIVGQRTPKAKISLSVKK